MWRGRVLARGRAGLGGGVAEIYSGGRAGPGFEGVGVSACGGRDLCARVCAGLACSLRVGAGGSQEARGRPRAGRTAQGSGTNSGTAPGGNGGASDSDARGAGRQQASGLHWGC